jgi:hypothetical protein
MKIKAKKCEFFCNKIDFLGHTVSNGNILPSESKIDAISTHALPRNVKEVQAFLGLAGYYRKFIRSFSTIARPLIDMTLKDATFEWTDEREKAFSTLREAITGDTVLMLPNFDAPFRLETDACDCGIGAVLAQQDENTKAWRPTVFYSKTLSSAEKKYSFSEKELLAIVISAEHFRYFLYGRDFVVLTDHQPLKWLLSVKNPAPRLARWIIRLQSFDFVVENKKGSEK